MDKVTVLLPVYNGANFLREAIKSVLAQTYKNFELLIINDGSTDTTKSILSSFTDKRIRIVNNLTNRGLVFSLNKGISLAKGRYIARMDADDICLPTRLEKQIELLKKNDYAAVGSLIEIFHDKSLKVVGDWQEDINNITPEQIYKQMPKGNCLAHPSMLIQREILMKYHYNPKQALYTEDYDLWLKILSDGGKIAKVNERLLRYRSHDGSASAITTSWYKRPQTRLIYVWSRIIEKKFNTFDLKVFLFLFPELLDYFKGRLELAFQQ